MDSLSNKIAVVTGGGTGMGRELVRQLAKEGCHVSMCDVIEENMQETYDIVKSESPDINISMHNCDVSIEEQVIQFKEEVLLAQDTNKINLLFNNAGIGGGGSFCGWKQRGVGEVLCCLLVWSLLLYSCFCRLHNK